MEAPGGKGASVVTDKNRQKFQEGMVSMKNIELKNIFRSKYVIRVAAGIVTVAVIGSSVGASVYTVRAGQQAVSQDASGSAGKEGEIAQAKETLEKALSAGEENQEAGKEETVYVVASPDGSAKSVIVSEWLKNRDGSATLTDSSDLKGIENVKGEETFTQNGDKLTWQADGKDIYYQGTTEKALPVTEKVTYFMDGKELSPEEMAGKSGRATIRFDYTNHEKTTQDVDGKKYEAYVPFTVLTGIILPEDYANVEVTNGKVISDGSKKVAVGLAMPGLKESLGIEEGDLEGDLEIPDYVEVSADVEDFSLEMSMSVIMNDLVSQADLSGKFDLGNLDQDLDDLTDASKQLMDGSKELSKGLGTLKNSMKEFASGVGSLKEGIASYTDGASQLNDGIHTLAGSSGTLTEGVGTLNSSAATLNSGVAELDKTLKAGLSKEEENSLIQQADAAIDAAFSNGETGAEAIQSQAAAAFYEGLVNNGGAKEQVAAGISTYTETVLHSVLDSAFSTAAAGTAKTEKMAEAKPQVVQAVTQAVVQEVTRQVTAGVVSAVIGQQIGEAAAQLAEAGGSLDAQTVAQICAAVNEAVNTEGSEAQQQINALIAQQDINGMVTQNVNAKMAEIEAQVDAGIASPEGQAQIQATVDGMVNQAVAAAMADPTLQAGMESAASQIVAGIADGAKDTVGTAVADTAKTAAKSAAESATLTAVSATKSQISQAINAENEASGYSLVSGMAALSSGTQAMHDSLPALTAGIAQLTNGAAELVSNNGALLDGAGKLSSATSQIGDGVSKLAEGSEKLMDGMVQFDEEGIQKLLDAYNGDIKELLGKLEAVAEAGKGYQTFTKVADGVKGSVKFILRTEAIQTEE